MRTLILITICSVCIAIAIWECRDRSDRNKVVTQGLVGLGVGLVIWTMIVSLGVFDNWK